MPDTMSPYFAVFNCHCNNADQRARAALRANGMQTWLDEVEAIESAEGGIMAIFQHDPTAATGAYVALVTVFANEGR